MSIREHWQQVLEETWRDVLEDRRARRVLRARAAGARSVEVHECVEADKRVWAPPGPLSDRKSGRTRAPQRRWTPWWQRR